VIGAESTTVRTPVRRVVYFNFGRGSGGLVVGIGLANAFRRAGIDVHFTAVTNNEFATIAEGFTDHLYVPAEPHLFMVADRRTRLYKALRRLRPELLIVYGSWMPILPLLDEIPCPRALIMRQSDQVYLHTTIPGVDAGPGFRMDINPADYDLSVTCEPGFELVGFQSIHPIIIRQRDEIFSRDEARRRLQIPPGKKLVVIARNGLKGELEELLARHSGGRESADIRANEWHELITTNKDGGGLFPLADYAAAIDLLISGGGYSTFYETRYFGIPAELEAFDRHAEDIAWRLRTNADYTFDVNGADEFVGLVGDRLGWELM